MFDPLAMCRILNEEGVEYVVLGGFGAIIHGSPLTTRDLDVVPQRKSDNLDRLGRASDGWVRLSASRAAL